MRSRIAHFVHMVLFGFQACDITKNMKSKFVGHRSPPPFLFCFAASLPTLCSPSLFVLFVLAAFEDFGAFVADVCVMPLD